MDRQALDVVVVAEEETLALLAFLELILVEDDADGGGVVDNLARAEVENVRRGVVQSRVAVHVVQLELRVRGFAAPHDVPPVELRGGEHRRATLGVENLPVVMKIVLRLVPVPRVAIHQRFHPEKTRGRRQERLDEHVVGHEPVAVVAVLDENSSRGGLRDARIRRAVRGTRDGVAREKTNRLERVVLLSRFRGRAEGREGGAAVAHRLGSLGGERAAAPAGEFHDGATRSTRRRRRRRRRGIVGVPVRVSGVRVVLVVHDLGVLVGIVLVRAVFVFVLVAVRAASPRGHEHGEVAISGEPSVSVLIHAHEHAGEKIAFVPRGGHRARVLALDRRREGASHAILELGDGAANAPFGVAAPSDQIVPRPRRRLRVAIEPADEREDLLVGR